MANPFSNIPEGKNVVRQNNWDWSHDNHLTTKLGAITPVFCQKVPPKTSLSINPRFGLKFMPMVFPVQNNIKARISFFKVPLRALWKDYQNWISSVNTEQHSKYVPPFLDFSGDETNVWKNASFKTLFGRGSLADYLGLPTDFDSSAPMYFNFNIPISYAEASISQYCFGSSSFSNRIGASFIGVQILKKYFEHYGAGDIKVFYDTRGTQPTKLTMRFCAPYNNTCVNVNSMSCDPDTVSSISYDESSKTYTFPYGSLKSIIDKTTHTSITIITPDSVLRPGTSVSLSYAPLSPVSPKDVPFYSSVNQTGLKLSSYPWRAYNAIYNAYYRNIRNNALKSYVDGSPIYNDYVIPYNYGGSEYVAAQKSDVSSSQNLSQYWADFFGMRYANWQLDAFTSAVASPQQGNAPLVGLTNTASVVVNQDGTQTATLNSYLTDEDGKTYKVLYNTDKEGLKSVEYLEQPIDGQIMPTAYAAVSQGISIADLRNVNAYTRYLELNMRRGYRYKDIVEGRFDVNVRYDELLMPEFCGGFTRSFDISPITQTVQTVPDGTTYSGALGSQAGDGICFGASDNRIKIYCDEESIVMGLLTVTPEPIYSQILPKFFLDRDVLDSFNPEFNALGFQPILNAEVAPIQAFKNGGMDSVNETFGYQRPWYNLVRLPNVAHGDFRGSLKNFIMNRTFEGVPVLGTDFTIINPDDVNDVFNVQENSDKIFGVVKFDITCKNGVSKSSVPRLE